MRVTLFIALLLLLKVSFGQGKYSVSVISQDQPKEFFTKNFSYKEKVKDSAQAVEDSKDLILKLRTAGYAGVGSGWVVGGGRVRGEDKATDEGREGK